MKGELIAEKGPYQIIKIHEPENGDIYVLLKSGQPITRFSSKEQAVWFFDLLADV